MGVKTLRNTGFRRSGGYLSRSRFGLSATLLALIVLLAAFYLGSRPGGISLPGFPAQTETATETEVPAADPALSRKTRATRLAANSSSPLLAENAPPDLQADALAAAEDAAAQVARRASDGGEDAEDEAGAPIDGSVLDDAGEPLPNRVVTAERLDLRSDRNVGIDRARTVTDQLGMFRFEPLPGDEYLLRVAEDEEFHAGRLSVRVGVSAAEIYLQRKGSIEVSGRVHDRLARPLAEVLVRSLGSRETAVSDQSGHYRIEVDRVKPGTAPVLEFSHAEHQDVRERIVVAPGQDSGAVLLDVVMPDRNDAASVSGWVSGPSNEPVAGAEVWLSSASPHASHRTRTDSLGAYEFQRVESGDHYRLGVEPSESDYQRYVSPPQVIGGDVNHDVRLKKAGDAEISGALVDPRGQPLPGFGIWLRQLEAGAPDPVFIQADQRGQFAPVKVQSGSLRLETHSSPQLEAGGIQLAAGESRFMQIPLDWGSAWLIGQVVDDADRPVQQAQVVAQWRVQDAEVISSSRRAVRVDQGGFFSFANLGASSYQLTVSAPGFQTRRIRVSPAIGEEILIPMQAQTSSAGGSP